MLERNCITAHCADRAAEYMAEVSSGLITAEDPTSELSPYMIKK